MKRLLVLTLLLAGCGGGAARGPEVVVSAAASLRDALTTLATDYESAHPGVTIRNNFGGSGTLEQQIRHGAGVGVFISAAEPQMDALEGDGLIVPGTRRDLLGNELVLVAPAGDTARVRGFGDLASAAVERVAIGAPESVPAGWYARATLQNMHLWSRVRPKAVLTPDVRQALAYAERGEVDAALVYRTDALLSRHVRIVAAAPAGSHPPIAYPAAVVAGTRDTAAARAYLDYLSSRDAAGVFRRYGFRAGAPVGG
ncbi:MAG TPA: molybdate ABC transporter substrate-binding protein [Longimicrobiaceae bacterium]|nr:molybdate ABC transporter substrate-binding protein [Longimicrobiaceae bacterium]